MTVSSTVSGRVHGWHCDPIIPKRLLRHELLPQPTTISPIPFYIEKPNRDPIEPYTQAGRIASSTASIQASSWLSQGFLPCRRGTSAACMFWM
jgi:hypothetical protein